MKLWLSGLFAVAVILVVGTWALTGEAPKKEGKAEELVGAKDGKKYHLASCAAAANIKDDNKVVFKSAQAAFEAGYEPCATCKPPVETRLVGSKDSDKYHFPSCKMAAKIKKANLVEFKSVEDAVKDKRTACTVCKPPAPAADETKKDEGKKDDAKKN